MKSSLLLAVISVGSGKGMKLISLLGLASF